MVDTMQSAAKYFCLGASEPKWDLRDLLLVNVGRLKMDGTWTCLTFVTQTNPEGSSLFSITVLSAFRHLTQTDSKIITKLYVDSKTICGHT